VRRGAPKAGTGSPARSISRLEAKRQIHRGALGLPLLEERSFRTAARPREGGLEVLACHDGTSAAKLQFSQVKLQLRLPS